ncbi:MAG: hypothetical protein ACLT3H_00865 [Roseburia sp.]
MRVKKPEPWVQNHENWCWAAAAKIVGLHFCKRKGIRPPVLWEEQYPNGIVREDLTGVLPLYSGCVGGMVTVDAWQYKIVERARDAINNMHGNLPEYDDAKVRALRYVVTGNVNDTSIQIAEHGFYNDEMPLWSQECFPDIERALDGGFALLGNFVGMSGMAHSVVLLPLGNTRIGVFDPCDGSYELYSRRQVFGTGFLAQGGTALIQWIQYIGQ